MSGAEQQKQWWWALSSVVVGVVAVLPHIEAALIVIILLSDPTPFSASGRTKCNFTCTGTNLYMIIVFSGGR